MSKNNKQILQTGKYEYEVNIYIKKTCANKSRMCYENVQRCTNVYTNKNAQMQNSTQTFFHRKQLKIFEEELEKGKEDRAVGSFRVKGRKDK